MLTSLLQSFETEVLTREENLVGLAALNRELIARAEAVDSPRRVVLDMDSTEIPVYGRQEQSAYHGHFESIIRCCCLTGRATAWPPSYAGNVNSADDWEELLLPEIDRQRAQRKEVAFRGDAAFVKPELYEALEKWDLKYAICLPVNDNLERNITELLTRPEPQAGGPLP